MAPKDAAHHTCLDRVLTLYACHQRILTFTPWNVNIWCIVSEACETSRIWWYLMNTRACEETNGAKRCSTSRLLRSSSNIVCVSPKNFEIYSLECVKFVSERYEYDDIPWISERLKKPMAPKDAAHHTCFFFTSCPEIISTSSNNILICSFGQWMHRVLECMRNHKFPLYVRKTGGAGAATHTSM